MSALEDLKRLQIGQPIPGGKSPDVFLGTALLELLERVEALEGKDYVDGHAEEIDD